MGGFGIDFSSGRGDPWDPWNAACLDTISTALVLLLAVVISGFISHVRPLPIPRPLVQIALGSLIAALTDFRMVLDPEVFFLLFVPPLLFLDGWRIPKEKMVEDGAVILNLSLGLVLFTMLGIGMLLHWLIPAMPLAVAFALAAVLSPTDPIALSAIAARVPMPPRMRHILDGEALLNDASSLVFFRFATIAAVTGTFSLPSAVMSLIWVALGGVAVGIAITWCTTRAKEWMVRRVGEDSGSQIIISLLIPFAAYLVAEKLHCSGILAAVAAGVTMSIVESSDSALPSTRLRRNTVWDTVQFAANGMIFVLLGAQLPDLLSRADETVLATGHTEAAWLLVYVVAIYVGMVSLRFAWVWISLSLTVLAARLRGTSSFPPTLRLVSATALAGVRGAITLAAVMTLPLTVGDGSPFPSRDLAIALAMGVIITSLLVASVCLPAMLPGLRLPGARNTDAEEDRARVFAAGAAIRRIERLQRELPHGHADQDAHAAAAALMTRLYRLRIEARSREGEAADHARGKEAVETLLRISAIEAERSAVIKLLKAQKIDGETARKLVRELDLLQARYEL